MIGGWLWDRKTTDAEAKRILRDPQSDGFISLASILLSRVGRPREVFKHYIKPLVFCEHWNRIKREMRKDKWSDPRIIYWQVVYEVLSEKYHKKGIVFRKEAPPAKEPLCKEVGMLISGIRRKEGFSQKELAKKIKVSQQLVSRVERGGENVSLTTLVNIAGSLNKKVEINFV